MPSLFGMVSYQTVKVSCLISVLNFIYFVKSTNLSIQQRCFFCPLRSCFQFCFVVYLCLHVVYMCLLVVYLCLRICKI